MSKLDLFFHLFGFYKEHWRAWHLGLFFFIISTLLVLDHFIVSANNEEERWKEQLWTAGLLTRCLTGIQVSSFEGGLCSLKTPEKAKSRVQFICCLDTWCDTDLQRFLRGAWKIKTNKKSCFRKPHGVFFSLVIPQLNEAESSARPSQADFRESFLFSSSKSSLSSSPTVVFKKATVRMQSWSPLVLWGHNRGDSCFILPANLHTWAKSLHHSQLTKVPWFLEI